MSEGEEHELIGWEMTDWETGDGKFISERICGEIVNIYGNDHCLFFDRTTGYHNAVFN
jgi:hypothetical protein